MGKAKSAGKAAAKAAKKLKQEKVSRLHLFLQLAERRASKQKKKGAKKDDVNDMDEEDLDALLAQYREEWEQQHSATEEHVVPIPSRRANATYVTVQLMTASRRVPWAMICGCLEASTLTERGTLNGIDMQVHVLPRPIPLHS